MNAVPGLLVAVGFGLLVARILYVSRRDPHSWGYDPKATAWRCQRGHHDWRFVRMVDRRRLDLSIPPFTVHHCTLTERCDRCSLTRTHQNADVPTKPKRPARPNRSKG